MLHQYRLPVNSLIYGILSSLFVLFWGGIVLDWWKHIAWIPLSLSAFLFTFYLVRAFLLCIPKSNIYKISGVLIILVILHSILQILESFGIIDIIPDHMILVTLMTKIAIFWNPDLSLTYQNVFLNAGIIVGVFLNFRNEDHFKDRRKMIKEFREEYRAFLDHQKSQ